MSPHLAIVDENGLVTIPQQTFSFTWKIEDNAQTYSLILQPVFDPYEPSGFSHKESVYLCAAGNTLRWRMSLTTSCTGVKLKLELGSGSENTKELSTRFQMQIVSPNGVHSNIKGIPGLITHTFRGPGDAWERQLESDVFQNVSSNLENVAIHCTIWIGCVAPLYKLISIDDTAEIANMRRLTSQLHQMLTGGEFSDVQIQTAEKTFYVHRNMLTAQSTVFRAMLTSSMVEADMCAIVIRDFDEGVVKAMLDYMYTGRTDELNQRAGELLQIADKYDLTGLKDDAEKALIAGIDISNSPLILALAHRHNCHLLKSLSMKFINLNKTEVLKTAEFKDMMKSLPYLVAELYLSETFN